MRFIKLSESNVVVAFRIGTILQDGEIESEKGELGQIMREDGSFITPEIEPFNPQPTIEEKILAENQYQTMLLELTTLGGI